MRITFSFLLIQLCLIAHTFSQSNAIANGFQFFYSDDILANDSTFNTVKSSSVSYLLSDEYASYKKDLIMPGKTGKISSRLFNNSWFKKEGKGYVVTGDIYERLWVGQETSSSKSIFQNKRGFFVNGKFGDNLFIHSGISEGPGRLESFVDDYTTSTRILPGEGEAKFNDNGSYGNYQAFGGIEYKAGKYIDLSLMHGKNFIGDGYRSLFLSDAPANYPFGKLNFHIGNKFNYSAIVAEWIHYTPDMLPAGNILRQKKYGSFHCLELKPSKKLTLALYEAVIWAADSGARSGLDLTYLNPFTVMRPYEFQIGSPDNVQIGTSFKYTPLKFAQFYGQFVLTEFFFEEFFGGNDWFGNKYAFQGGLKLHNIPGVKNLYLQLEYNHIRPFTYNHRKEETTFAHFGQALAHPSGSNLRELVLIGNYRINRFNINLKSLYKVSGLENTDSTSIGSDVLRPYTIRESEYGNVLGQGIPHQQFHNTFKLSYLINPSNMMFAEIGLVNRHQIIDGNNLQQNYIFVGIRTDIANFYYDF